MMVYSELLEKLKWNMNQKGNDYRNYFNLIKNNINYHK